MLEKDNEQYIGIVDPLIKLGNFNEYYYFGKNLLKKIKVESIVNKKLFLISKKIFYSFLDLSISPLRLKVKYGDEFTPFKSYQLTTFLDLFRNNLYKETSNFNKNLLDNFIDCLFSIAFELGKSKHYGENNSFERLGKEYLMLDIAKNKKRYFNNNKLIICCFNPMESSIIKNLLDQFDISDVFVKNIHWLNKSLLDNKEEYNLLLPGPLPLKYFSELFMPYSKILILSYEGQNNKKLSKQLESIEYIHNIEINNSLKNIREVCDYLNIENSRIIEDLENNLDVEDVDSEIDIDRNQNSFDDEISIMIKNIFKNANLSDDFEESEKIERELADQNSKLKDRQVIGKTYEFTLKNIESGEIIYKKLQANKSYNYFNKQNKLLEGSPKVIKEGNFVIFIDNDDKKTLLELVIEVYDLGLAVDKNSIDYWKNRLMNYVLINGLTGVAFNREFNEISGTNKTMPATNRWIKGEALGPQNATDLLWVGKLINDNVLIENYNYMFEEIEKIRNIHRITGRRLNSIIKEIMGGKRNFDNENLGYVGQLFYNKIKNGVYEVISRK